MNKETKNKVIVYVILLVLGLLGIYLTFISSDTKKFDRETKAYKIEPNERYDSDDGIVYYPNYYFKVNGNEYICSSKSGSSSYPNESKNKVYYDSTNPEKCLTEYEKSSSKFAGIICLVVTIVFFIIYQKKPSTNEFENKKFDDFNIEKQYEENERQQKIRENIEKVAVVVDNIRLIRKRVILGIIIFILLIFNLFDTMLFKQTVTAKNYYDATAVYVKKKEEQDSNIFDDYIYTFNDKEGNRQEIIVNIAEDENPVEEINIKYNPNNPEEYFTDTALLDKSGLMWYGIKIVILVLLIFLFFNKRLLNKINFV